MTTTTPEPTPPATSPFTGEITPLIRALARAINIESIDAAAGQSDLHLASRIAQHLSVPTDPATYYAGRASDLTKSTAALSNPAIPQLTTAFATLAVAAEQRTANLIAEAGRLTHALAHTDPLLITPGHRARIAGVLEQIHHLVHDRLNLTPDAAPTQVMPTQVTS